MRYRFAVIGLCVACLVLGDDAAKQRVQVSKTEKVDFPAGGTLNVRNSTGELVIEGWDQPGVEIMTTKSSKEEYLPKDREKAAKELERVRISTKTDGNELVVTTEFPHHRAFPYVMPLDNVTNFDLEYRIKVPRTARLVVKHEDGDVHVDDVLGNIQVTARQGLISLRLTGDMPRFIDAKTDLGSVNSDFAGTESRRRLLWPFEEKYVESGSGSAQNLHLKMGFGDIVILKAHDPQSPAPIT